MMAELLYDADNNNIKLLNYEPINNLEIISHGKKSRTGSLKQCLNPLKHIKEKI